MNVIGLTVELHEFDVKTFTDASKDTLHCLEVLAAKDRFAILRREDEVRVEQKDTVSRRAIICGMRFHGAHRLTCGVCLYSIT